ncbi:polyprenyl synthetase family protein [Streptomyces sp. 7-21]|uniref:polyprenyl synthetase family protein n=1 Tax=Streptomyces sp. 7-21 TaxID=2802283 RepID=UPI00191D673E|nr:polyprenyl synthetase family protein [Streptomyces sp. 7-21]MBL1065962.1 polyprenyl synthetase family protein [Streptomyces sp. 7-21]
MSDRLTGDDDLARVEAELERAVDRLDPDVARVCRYHLGWSGVSGTRGAGGKRVRAALAALSARSAGGAGELAAAAGAAVELVHQFSLLHDDIMDGDRSRRGRDAAWVAYGTGHAVLAGDALLVQAVRTVTAAPGPGAATAAGSLVAALEATVNGQARDLALERREAGDVTVSEYLAMVAGKTGALLACAAALGAELAGAPAAVTGPLRRAGEELGVAFQITDDVLGLWGEHAVTGKPVGADLLRGKKTLPVLLAVGSGTGAGRRAAAMLGTGKLEEDDVPVLLGLLEEAGAREGAREMAAQHTRRAAKALDEARLPAAARAAWEDLMTRLGRRDR